MKSKTDINSDDSHRCVKTVDAATCTTPVSLSLDDNPNPLIGG